MEKLLEILDFRIAITEQQLEYRKKSVQRLSQDYHGSVINLATETHYLAEQVERLKTLKEVRELVYAMSKTK